eukprot:13244165-Alexandrium_andersonii.AAC.1
MRVEHNVPVVPAEFGQADLLGAESDVINFILRFFGSAHRALPVLTARTGGLEGDDRDTRSHRLVRNQALPGLAGAGSLAGSTLAHLSIDAVGRESEPGKDWAQRRRRGAGSVLPTVFEP